MGKTEKIPGENSAMQALSFDGLMDKLCKIEGYRASAILTCDGEVLHDTTPPGTAGNFGAWMRVFNNLFDHTCNLSEISGFFACQQVSMRTGDEIIIIHSAGQHCQVGLRLLVILDHRGNATRINKKLEKLLPPLMRHLTMAPDNLASYLKAS